MNPVHGEMPQIGQSLCGAIPPGICPSQTPFNLDEHRVPNSSKSGVSKASRNMPSSMIEGIRRIGKRPTWGGNRWDADQELEPEAEADFESPDENTVLVSPMRAVPTFISSSSGGVEYQRNLVRAAIEQGGKLHNHEISIPWLKTILAGLEGRAVEPDEMWGEIETPDPLEPPKGPEPPSYYDLFPDEKESPDSAPS